MNRKFKFLTFISLALGMTTLLAACGNAQNSVTAGSYQKLTAEEAKGRMDSGENIIILDVRTQEEFDASHIPGAILIPNETIGTEPLEELPDLEQEILVYCRSGNRSKQAAEKLLKAGYTAVYDFGGINSWPYETVSGTGEESLSDEPEEPVTNSLFGEFTAPTLDGGEATQEIFAQSKLTMVNIWGTYCGPCIREMPDLGALHTEYADRGFQIVGIVADVSQASDPTALQIVETTGANYTHILASPSLMGVLQQVQSIPTTIFIDEQGNQVGFAYAGARSKEKWAAIVDELLEEVNDGN